MTDLCETSNLLGALVLAFHDEMRAAVEKTAGRAGESPSAVVVLGQHPGLSNDRLRHLLGLSHPGVVRLIDRLNEDGLVERRPSPQDGRAIELYLTEAGERARSEILAARSQSLRRAVSGLDATDQAALKDLMIKLLQKAPRDDLHKLRICRLCDGTVCLDCPMLEPVTAHAVAR